MNGIENNSELSDTEKEVRRAVQARSTCLKLTGLLSCLIRCLKGGQTFQYTSLVIVNLIIDTVIRHDLVEVKLPVSQLSFDPHLSSDSKSTGNSNKTGQNAFSSSTGKNDNKDKTSSAAANLSKHFRNRINESFNFKQNFIHHHHHDKSGNKQTDSANSVTDNAQSTPTKKR